MNEKVKRLPRQILSLAMITVMLFSLLSPLSVVASAQGKAKTEENYRKNVKTFSLERDIEYENSGYIRNEYVEAYIRSDGCYTMGTVLGDPSNELDDGKLLLFGHPSPWSSETLVRVDGEDYYFHNYVSDVEFRNSVDDEYTECVSTANIYGIEVKQILTISMNPFSGMEDLVTIRYEYKNKSSESKSVGIRIMLDTMLGDNDGAPFRVNGEDVTTEIEFSGNNIPQYWQSFDSLEEPRVTSSGFFYFAEGEKPDKVQFADWPGINGSSWEYQIDEYDSLTGDSAVAAYFNPRIVAAGGSNSVVTYYGISGFSSGNSDLEGDLGVRVTAPSELYGSDMISGYLNNPFSVSAYVTNRSEETLSDVRAVLSLADAPQLVLDSTQATTVNFGDLEAGTGSVAQWTIRALPQGESSEAKYTINFYEGSELLKSMELKLILTELNQEDIYRNVKFDLNGAQGTAPQEQKVIIGTFVDMPEAPKREGYVFGGWYSNKNCTGMPWFNIFNLFKGNLVTEDVTLYAKWNADMQTVIYGKDTFNFINTYYDFFEDGFGDYEVTGDYFDVLIEGLNRSERTSIINEMNSAWGGSCFGMAAVLALVKAERLNEDFFQRGASCLYDFDEPRDNATIFNLINYYYLMQLSPITAAARSDYDHNNEKANNKRVIEALDESDYPVVLGFNILNSAGNRVGGHAVIAYGYTTTETGYLVDIWDPNDDEAPNTLRISKDYATSDFETTYDSGEWNSYIKYALTVEDRAYDYKNIQNSLMNLGNTSGADTMSFLSNAIVMLLDTNYDSFTITDSEGATATIENGLKVSGDLEISNAEYLNEAGEELRLQFVITGESGTDYTIVPAQSVSAVDGEELEAYFTALSYDDEEDGFYSSLTAEGAGIIRFDADGKLSTEFEKETKHKITVSANDSTTPWYAQTVEGSATDLTVAPEREGASISSSTEAMIDVSARNDYNSISFDTYSLSSDEDLKLVQSEENANTAVLGDQEATIGHSLAFITSGGSVIPTQTDIPSGETAEMPSDPERDGFVFAGWYTTEICTDGEEWSFDTPITEDTRIYAKWLVDNSFAHTVTFRAEGHDDIIINVRNNEGLSEDEIPEVPEKLCSRGEWDVNDFSEITANIIVNATYEENHDYEETSREDASCTESGSVSYKCTVCDKEYTEEIKAAHYDGDGDAYCDVCGALINDIEIGVSKTITVEEDETVYFKFTPSTTARYRFESLSEEDDTYGYLFDENMDEIESDDDDGDGVNFAISQVLTAGETYYFGARFLNSSRSGSFDVLLTKFAGIADIEVADVNLIENYNGYYDEEYEYFLYEYCPQSITLYFDDDTTLTGSYDEIVYEYGYNFEYSDNQRTTPWGVGTYTVDFTLDSFEGTFDVIVEENPIDTIAIDTVEITEGTNGYISTYDIEDDYGNTVGYECYYKYDVYTSMTRATVTFKNGDTISGTLNDIANEINCDAYIISDQTYNNQWKVGNNIATANVMGVTQTFNVKINPHNIASVTVNPIVTMQNTGGYYVSHWIYDSETDEEIRMWWYRYDVEPETVTIRYKNGSIVTVNADQLYNDYGFELISWDEQNWDNQFVLGKNTAKLFVGNCPVEYTVEVTEFDESKLTYTQISAGQTVNYDVPDEETSYTYLKFEPTYTGIYTIYSVSDLDPSCYLTDGKLNCIAYNHDVESEDNYDEDFSITHTLVAGETYYFVVRAYGWDSEDISVSLILQEITGCRHTNAKDYSQTNPTCTTVGYTAGKYCPDCKVWFSGHKVIKATGHNSNVTISAVAPTCSKAGLTAGKKCSVCGAIVVKQKSIPATGNHNKSITIPGKAATYTSAGLTEGKKCSFCGKIMVPQTTIAKLDITKAKVDGLKAKKVKVAKSSEITLSWTKLGEGVKYEVYQKVGKKWKKVKTTSSTSYTVKKLKADKEYKFRVRAVVDGAKSAYSKTLTVETIPATTSLKLKAGKKQLTASWSKVSDISGYEVQYSTSKKMKSAKTVSAKKSSKKTTIKKLSKGKKYYVRIRAYKTVNGKKIYSDWSKVKNVKVK